MYLLEHNLDLQALGKLYRIVGNHLLSQGMVEVSSNGNTYIPLLVAATEVAYQYQGNGTEYWPMLSKELGYTFTMFERTVLRELFENFHKQHNGPVPPDTEWSRNFSIICWPMANALLPLDMRLPFSEALANATFDITGMSDGRRPVTR